MEHEQHHQQAGADSVRSPDFKEPATYAQLKLQAEEILRQAERLRRNEMVQVIQEIKDRMSEYGLTVADLTDRRTQAHGSTRSRAAKIVRFKGPGGEAWSGGPGRKPEWVHKVLSEGGDIEKYRIAA